MSEINILDSEVVLKNLIAALSALWVCYLCINLPRNTFHERNDRSNTQIGRFPSKSRKRVRAQAMGWKWLLGLAICFGLSCSACSYIVYRKVSLQRIRKNRFIEPDVSEHFYRCGSAAERTCCTRDGVSYYVININYH